MSSRSRKASVYMALGSSMLDGYSGNFDIVSRYRPWWRRLLRLPSVSRRERVYGNVKGTEARMWRRS